MADLSKNILWAIGIDVDSEKFKKLDKFSKNFLVSAIEMECDDRVLDIIAENTNDICSDIFSRIFIPTIVNRLCKQMKTIYNTEVSYADMLNHFEINYEDMYIRFNAMNVISWSNLLVLAEDYFLNQPREVDWSVFGAYAFNCTTMLFENVSQIPQKAQISCNVYKNESDAQDSVNKLLKDGRDVLYLLYSKDHHLVGYCAIFD